jgi:WSC domain
MTAAFCGEYCNGAISPARFYPYMGVEDGAQCFCATAPSSPLGAPTPSGCGSPCIGDNGMLCGSAAARQLDGGPGAAASGGLHASGATIGVAVLAALFGLAALGAVALWFFARRRRAQRLSAQALVGHTCRRNSAWPAGQAQPQFQPQYQPQYQPLAELSNQHRSPVELRAGQPERRT